PTPTATLDTVAHRFDASCSLVEMATSACDEQRSSGQRLFALSSRFFAMRPKTRPTPTTAIPEAPTTYPTVRAALSGGVGSSRGGSASGPNVTRRRSALAPIEIVCLAEIFPGADAWISC